MKSSTGRNGVYAKRSVAVLVAVVAVGLGHAPASAETAADAESPEASEMGVRNISVASAARLLGEDTSVVVLDIRTPAEFSRGHIPGARNIDYMASDFEAALSSLDRETRYLMHCQSGGRSGKATPKFEALGFTEVLHLDAGFAGWEAAGEPVEKQPGS